MFRITNDLKWFSLPAYSPEVAQIARAAVGEVVVDPVVGDAEVRSIVALGVVSPLCVFPCRVSSWNWMKRFINETFMHKTEELLVTFM